MADRRPLKVFLPNQAREKPVTGGGGSGDPFTPVTPDVRASFATRVNAISAALAPALDSLGVAPVRVQLVSQAYAKTHRPKRLLSENSCPIIGAGGMGELFIRATKGGLEELRKEFEGGQAKQLVKDISTIATIEPVTPLMRRRKRSPGEILTKSPRQGSGYLVRVRLFDFNQPWAQDRAVTAFRTFCEAQKIEVRAEGYTPESYTYGAVCRNAEQVEALSKLIQVRSIIGMPRITSVLPANAGNAGAATTAAYPTRATDDIPIVVVVDSGISTSVAGLGPWTVGRSSTVALEYRNPDHGTAVASLIVAGDTLNSGLADIDTSPCGVFDLQVIPNADPGAGDIEEIDEQSFLQTLADAVKEHSNKYKVWNLSIGTDEVCDENDFSEFAFQLDNLQEEYKVSFVLAAGNYDTRPLLAFPRDPDDLARFAAGRITAPADSVLGIAVGSIQQMSYDGDGIKENELSPFSRHGPGPNYVIKPDLVHFGGSCTLDLGQVDGVNVGTPSGIGRMIGTSFAAPLVSRTLAQIYHQVTPAPDPVLARALLTHHARDPRSGGRVPTGEEQMFGFGRPVPPPYCLECSPYQATLIFTETLRPGFFLEWDHFPYPEALKRDGRYFGEVSMTLAFAPSRGNRWGVEYCESHVEAKFGVYRTKPVKDPKPGKPLTREEFRSLVPPEHKEPVAFWEKDQVRELRKWAPVRTFHADFGEKGEVGERWRLKLQLLSRHEGEAQPAKPQPLALIVTITDPTKTHLIYDQMVKALRGRFEVADLRVRGVAPQVRINPNSGDQ